MARDEMHADPQAPCSPRFPAAFEAAAIYIATQLALTSAPVAGTVHASPRRPRGRVSGSALLWAALNMHFAVSPGRRQRLNFGAMGNAAPPDWASLLEP